jgi:hypothetical protein
VQVKSLVSQSICSLSYLFHYRMKERKSQRVIIAVKAAAAAKVTL